jgi:alpha,alpha-trehalase
MADKKHGSLSVSAFDAAIFDMDGVVTQTAKVHAAAWKRLFDGFLKRRSEQKGEVFEPFDIERDYRRYVDGKPRYEGVRSFLESRGIALPYGSAEDPPERETICGLGNKKNVFFHEHLDKYGVEVYEHAVAFIHQLRGRGLRTAIVSSSKNCSAVLEAAHIRDLFDAKVDGVDVGDLGLEGKPSPDVFLEAARRLAVDPRRALVLEDAISGVQAGKKGHFGCVIGVDRAGNGGELKRHGADKVVRDLSEISLDTRSSSSDSTIGRLPSASEELDKIAQRIEDRKVVVFLDYDGTLTPIVQRPEMAVLSEEMRATVSRLASHCTVAVISGRDLRDVRDRVGIGSVFYAGSHGFDIAGPEDTHMENQLGVDFLPILDQAEKALKTALSQITGVRIERKKFSIAVHYREVEIDAVPAVEAAVAKVLQEHQELRRSHGKKVYDLQPRIEWHKGKALLWLLEKFELDTPNIFPFYIGDDITDEDAFGVLEDRGLGIVVAEGSEFTRKTHARYTLKNPQAVQNFLEALTDLVGRR